METTILAQCRTQGWFEKGRQEKRSSSASEQRNSTKFKRIRSHPQINKQNPANIHESFRIKNNGRFYRKR